MYNRNKDDEFDEAHYNKAKIRKVLLELGMQNPFYTSNDRLNEKISIKEIKKNGSIGKIRVGMWLRYESL